MIVQFEVGADELGDVTLLAADDINIDEA